MPEIKLLISIDVLIYELEEIKSECFNKYQGASGWEKLYFDKVEGIFYEKIYKKISEVINNNKRTDSFIQLLYLNRILKRVRRNWRRQFTSKI